MRAVDKVDLIDIALSYTDASLADVNQLKQNALRSLSVYDYRDWLLDQTGETVARVSEAIYCEVPCIVFATGDWFERAATKREANLLRRNRAAKLVFDYRGRFSAEADRHQITNFELGKFTDDGDVDVRCVTLFLAALRRQP